MADIDSLIRNLREKNVPGEKLLEISAALKLKKHKRNTLSRTLAKVQKYIQDNALIAVPFDRDLGFWVMKKSLYAEKLEKVLDCKQFRKLDRSCDGIVMKNEKGLNEDLLDMRKKKIPVNDYEALKSTGEQPARLYGLAKGHKKKAL